MNSSSESKTLKISSRENLKLSKARSHIKVLPRSYVKTKNCFDLIDVTFSWCFSRFSGCDGHYHELNFSRYHQYMFNHLLAFRTAIQTSKHQARTQPRIQQLQR